jgi:cytochrome c-type biogenesis protein CcmH
LNFGLAVALVGLTCLALAILLVPLLLVRRGAASRDAYNLAVYRDQLAEVERDIARGLLAADEAEAARIEIARRILALRPAGAEIGTGPIPLAMATVVILLLPLAAWMVYGQLGSPALPDQPFADRGGPGTPDGTPAARTADPAGTPRHTDISDAVARLAAHLKEHPEDLTGWVLLARSELSLGGFPEAAEAYRHAAELSGHRADIMGEWGEAQVLAAGGMVTPAAGAAFEAGLGDPESAPRSRYYLALVRLQEGDAKGALQGWVDLAADAPADAEWLALVRQRIAEAASALGIDPASLKPASGAPAGAAVAAAAKAAGDASPEQRQAMINAMVERLAARLEEQPDDVDGWVRLGRSYMVLNQPDKARDAYARAAKLKPDDAGLKAALADATAAGKPAATAPPQNGPR